MTKGYPLEFGSAAAKNLADLPEEENRAEQQAKASYNYFVELYEKLDKVKSEKERDELEQELDESDYGVNVTKTYEIILGGGGPATRISGELDERNEPYTARLEYQDWGTPWTEYRPASEELLLRFAQRHYFGE